MSAEIPDANVRKKRKYMRLPTPPPDPTLAQNEDPKAAKDKEIFEYLESLQRSIHPNFARSNSNFGPVLATDEAFDHLEKLYKLMEQMLELREQNSKLHRKIRDLEYLNNIEKMHRQLEISGVERNCPDLDKDTAFAETILESILSETKKDNKLSRTPTTRLRPSILRRNRHNSGNDKTVTLEAEEPKYEGILDAPKSAKVSKWTKVKAAFRWEKASNSVSDTKSQDSGFGGGITPNNMEIARYLRVPSTSEEGHSPADSGAAGISTPGSLSTASSNDDFHRSSELRTPCEDFRGGSSDEDHYIPHKHEGKKYHHHHQQHRTPWAKMKDIIQTRNSIKKKQRLSAASDDIQIDVELCSDNEDVFEEDTNKLKPSCSSSSPSPNPNFSSYTRSESSEIPSDIIDRYQRALMADKSDMDRKVSKWTRVKKAFLTDTPSINLDDEIEMNYRELQKKISLEFKEKRHDWERQKQSSPSNTTASCGLLDDTPDSSFMKKLDEWHRMKSTPSNIRGPPMTNQFDLPPEFKKKLQEWEKIKRSSRDQSKKKLGDFPRWKSVSGHKTEHSSNTFEYPVLSDDFKKKLYEWREIKAGTKLKDKTPSPKMYRKDSNNKSSKKLPKDDKELHWVEKELTKIEKEKQRLERERQKFLEREEKLSKLRRSVVGGNKKEVLIHTPSGFYRFEGISRKFTQKLYEWEKAQGIGPEASTFALLSSPYLPENFMKTRKSSSPPLVRSKSADSVAIAVNTALPLLSQQPSSLSLNDMEELEKECLADSKSSSLQYVMLHSHEASDVEEPEALIVEVEDYEEETAAPLQTFVRVREELPIYQREEVKIMCEGETVAAPKIQRSESARAQTNYNLIEDILTIVKNSQEDEKEFLTSPNPNLQSKSLNHYENQCESIKKILSKLLLLQEANLAVVSLITQESGDAQTNSEPLEAVQDLSAEILHLSETLNRDIEDQIKEISNNEDEDWKLVNLVWDSLNEIKIKMLELRRKLSYVCAASDITAPNRSKSLTKKLLMQKISSDSRESRCDTSDNSSSNKTKEHFLKASNKLNSSQGAVKRKIKMRQKSLQQNYDTDDEDERNNNGSSDQRRKHKKLTRARSVTEQFPFVDPLICRDDDEDQDEDKEKIKDKYKIKDEEEDSLKINLEIDPRIVERFIVPTETNYVNVKPVEFKESPVTVFVKTTRKLFTPIGEVSTIGSFGNFASDKNSSKDDSKNFDTKNSDSKNLDSKNFEIRNSKSKNSDLKNFDAKNLDSKNSKLKNSDSKNFDTKNSDSGNFDEKNSDSKNSNSKNFDPKNSDLKNSNSKNSNSKNFDPKNSDLKNSNSKNSNSKNFDPKNLDLKNSNSKTADLEDIFGNSNLTSESHEAKTEDKILPPPSPLPQRKIFKEVSPNIKIMMAKYNQNLEKEQIHKKSPVNSGSNSPIAWRSPTAERRVKAQTERYQESLKNLSPLLKREVQKSASVGYINPPPKVQVTLPNRNLEIQKSASEKVVPNPPPRLRHSPEIRMKKLQKAKEEFLKSEPLSAPADLKREELKFPARNRLSQISVDDSESSFDSAYGALIKSASAGMINIDPESYKQFDPEVHGGGYVSLPRSSSRKPNLSRFAFANIASKFRKVRMRKGKEKEKMNAVSTLCRQSLVVTINPQEGGINNNGSENGNFSTAPSTSGAAAARPARSASATWIKSKLFKK